MARRRRPLTPTLSPWTQSWCHLGEGGTRVRRIGDAPTLWPFATVALQQATGSFALAFLCIPAFMIAMAIGVWLSVPEHAGKELNAIIV